MEGVSEVTSEKGSSKPNEVVPDDDVQELPELDAVGDYKVKKRIKTDAEVVTPISDPTSLLLSKAEHLAVNVAAQETVISTSYVGLHDMESKYFEELTGVADFVIVNSQLLPIGRDFALMVGEKLVSHNRVSQKHRGRIKNIVDNFRGRSGALIGKIQEAEGKLRRFKKEKARVHQEIKDLKP